MNSALEGNEVFFYRNQDSYLIDHFTVLFLVTWPLNESEAGVDLVLIETSLLLLRKNPPNKHENSIINTIKAGRVSYQNKVNSSLTFIQMPDN